MPNLTAERGEDGLLGIDAIADTYWTTEISTEAAVVERSLYERANGHNYEAVKIFMPAGAKKPVIVHYVEHCPPDVGAAFIWLKNRDAWSRCCAPGPPRSYPTRSGEAGCERGG
jgi:hypothetical protein